MPQTGAQQEQYARRLLEVCELLSMEPVEAWRNLELLQRWRDRVDFMAGWDPLLASYLHLLQLENCMEQAWSQAPDKWEREKPHRDTMANLNYLAVWMWHRLRTYYTAEWNKHKERRE